MAVFDFDWSLVNENSDTWIIKQLAPELEGKIKALYNQKQWTDLMDHALGLLHGKGIKPEKLKTVLGGIPFFPEMQLAVKRLHAKGVKLYILSDANTVYIEAILSATGLGSCFSGVYRFEQNSSSERTASLLSS